MLTHQKAAANPEQRQYLYWPATSKRVHFIPPKMQGYLSQSDLKPRDLKFRTLAHRLRQYERAKSSINFKVGLVKSDMMLIPYWMDILYSYTRYVTI